MSASPERVQMGANRYLPDCIRNDAVASSIIAAQIARNASYGPGRTVILEPTSQEWADRMEGARWLDAFAVGNHGQRDHGHHLCCEQNYQQRDGFRIYELGSWIGGGAVRDTHNDGDGTVFGGRYKPRATFAECLAWSRKWHAEKPTHRKLLLGFWWDHALNRVLSLAELQARPDFTGVRS
jgi:hypothetical protein